MMTTVRMVMTMISDPLEILLTNPDRIERYPDESEFKLFHDLDLYYIKLGRIAIIPNQPTPSGKNRFEGHTMQPHDTITITFNNATFFYSWDGEKMNAGN